MSKFYRLAEAVAYVASPISSAAYIGFVGHENLGDEVLWQQIKKSFSPMTIVSAPSRGGFIKNTIINIRKYDKVILGGGTLIGRNRPDGSNSFREEFCRFFSQASRAISFGTGVGKLSDQSSENAWLLDWKPLLEKFEYIGVRGPMSVQSLASIGIEAELLGDPACLMSKEPGFWSPPRVEEKVLGINLGPIPHWSKLDEMKESNFAEVLTHLVQERVRDGWKIEFFAVCPDDLVLIDAIVADSSLSDCKVHKIYESGDQYLDAVKHVSAFVGMKLHSVILAMCAGVPSIMVSYAPKCNDFMKSVESHEFTINLEDVNLEDLNALIEKVMGSADQLSAHIARQMNRLKAIQQNRAAILREQFSQSKR